MQLTEYKNIYFIGIGGIGMSALARWFVAAGYNVSGYDKTPSDITNKLLSLGIEVSFSDEIDEIPESIKSNKAQSLIIYTPAIPNNHKGFNYFKNSAFTLIKRSAALGMLVQNKRGIAVAGTHGKTSVSSNIACMLNATPQGCNAFLGGIAINLNSNMLIQPNSNLVVIEADEYDRSFLTLYPEIAIVTAIDADHLDIYSGKDDIQETFELFISQVKTGGAAIIKQGVELNKAVNTSITYYSYALSDVADFYATDIEIVDGFYHFNVVTPKGVITNMQLGVPGLYNLENAIAAIAACYLVDTSEDIIRQSVKEYAGVNRRFEYQIKSDSKVFIDDYAHHPAEIKACVESVRHLYPNKKIVGIFQPHLFTRTRDFVDEFAESLDLLDELILTDIYPAREEPIEGVTSAIIYNKTTLKTKQLVSYDNVVKVAENSDADIVLTMGAGDIDRLVPQIKIALERRFCS